MFTYRKNILKLVLVGAAACISTLNSWAAGGPLDGLYQCAFSGTGITWQAYYSIVGYPVTSGTAPAILTTVALSSSQPVYGFAIGQASAQTFVGTTNVGTQFNLTASNNTLTGTTGVLFSNGTVVNVNVNCSKLF